MCDKNSKRANEVRAFKSEYIQLFRALNAGFRRHNGGARNIAKGVGYNDSTFRNMFSTDENSVSMPSLRVFLKTIELMPDQTVMNTLCGIAGGRFVRDEKELHDYEDACDCALSSMGGAAKFIRILSEALQDGEVSINEAKEILDALEDLDEQKETLKRTLLSLGSKKAAELTTAQTKQIATQICQNDNYMFQEEL